MEPMPSTTAHRLALGSRTIEHAPSSILGATLITHSFNGQIYLNRMLEQSSRLELQHVKMMLGGMNDIMDQRPNLPFDSKNFTSGLQVLYTYLQF